VTRWPPRSDPGRRPVALPGGCCKPLDLQHFGPICLLHRRLCGLYSRSRLTDKPGLDALEQELRDRFGSVPPPLALLLLVAEVKVLASERGVTVIEVQEDRLMLTRNNDYIMVGSKFPRLMRKQAGARLKEIKQLLTALN